MFLRNILLVVGAIALIAGMSLAALWLVQRPAKVPPGVAPKPVETHSILVAAYPLHAGTLLRSADFTWKAVPVQQAGKDNIVRDTQNGSDIVGAVTMRGFGSGEAILASGLLKPGDRRFLSAVLSPGMRAVTIAVDATQTASGLLLPDNRVDVILTQSFGEQAPDAARKSVGETVLEDLRVIALDQRLTPPLDAQNSTMGQSPAVTGQPQATNGQPQTPKTVTLEANERQAQMLLVAGQLGKVEISVRALARSRPGDEEEQPALAPAPVWASDVSPALKTLTRAPAPATASAPAARPVPARTAAEAPAKFSVEVIHGSKSETR